MSTNPTEKPHQTLSLPAPTAESASNVEIDGQSVKIDALGPLVVNSDGTLSRIANWSEMTEPERNNTVRVLAKRNKLRIEEQERKSEST